MSRITTTVPGHALKGDARPYTAEGEQVNRGEGTAGEGRALCECGWLSDSLPSGNKRRDAHRVHRQDVLDGTYVADLLEPVEPAQDAPGEHATEEQINAAIAAGEKFAASAPKPAPKKAKTVKEDQGSVEKDIEPCPHNHSRSARAAAECLAYRTRTGKSYVRPENRPENKAKKVQS